MFSKIKSDTLLSYIRDGKQMTSGEKLSLIIQLSIPAILAQVTGVLMFFIDASMVGSLGARASASIGLVESATWMFNGLTGAASMGFSVQVAHFIGSKDFDKARQVLRNGYFATLLISIVISAVAVLIAMPLPFWLGGGEDIANDASMYFFIYALTVPFLQLESISASMLKSSGNMRIPSLVSVLMCLLDVVFNYLFIFPSRELSFLDTSFVMPGAGLGVAGAALGTSLAIIISSLILFYFTVVKSPFLSVRVYKMRFTIVWDYLRNAIKIGMPMALQFFLMSGAHIVSIMIVSPLGNFAIAANTFAITAESLCYMPGYGIGDAATTLVGQSVGAGQRELSKSFARMSVFLGMLVMAVMGAIMYITAPQLMGIMTPVSEIRELGVGCLRIEAFAEPMFAAAIVTYCVCIGAGDTLRPAIMNLASMWLVRLTLAAILAPVYGLHGVWFAMAFELTVRGTMFMYRLFKGKWMRI